MSPDGFDNQYYEVRSDKLIEGYNAQVGNSTIIVTWKDTNSGQTATASFILQILHEAEYYRKIQSGALSTEETANPSLSGMSVGPSLGPLSFGGPGGSSFDDESED